jgi:succinoglycan biosynthesis protein ExoM
MTCSICIPTYKRPLLLKKLLISLFEQDLQEGISLEIIVVDNDAKESARSTCAEIKNTEKVVLYYLTQPEKNISLTRNMAVKKASGEYILFADDDVVVNPSWVYWHLNTMEKYKADIVIGRAISAFEVDVPDYIRKHEIFNPPSPKTGTTAVRLYTGNSSLKAKLITEMDEPFDVKLGLVGGEDGKLFETLRQNGANIVCCYEAVAFENIPLEASSVDWMLKRSFRQGYTHTRNFIKLEKGKDNFFSRAYLALKSLVFEFASIVLVFLTFFNKTYMVHWLTKMYSNCGHFLAAVGYEHKDLI